MCVRSSAGGREEALCALHTADDDLHTDGGTLTTCVEYSSIPVVKKVATHGGCSDIAHTFTLPPPQQNGSSNYHRYSVWHTTPRVPTDRTAGRNLTAWAKYGGIHGVPLLPPHPHHKLIPLTSHTHRAVEKKKRKERKEKRKEEVMFARCHSYGDGRTGRCAVVEGTRRCPRTPLRRQHMQSYSPPPSLA